MNDASSPDRFAASVIIPAFNAEETIGDQLEGLAAQAGAPRFEVIVADNGSADGTRHVVAGWVGSFERLVVLDASQRRGPCAARNLGAAAASSDVFLFCDADDRAEPMWVSSMVAALSQFDLVGGRLLDDRLNSEVVRSWYAAIPDGLFNKYAGFLLYASGANLGVTRELFETIGGWDETFTNATDADFCFRAQLDGGARIGYARDATMQYRFRGDLAGMSRNMRSYGRADVQLAERYWASGLRPRSAASILRSWGVLAARSPELVRGTTARGRWIRRASVEAGRLGENLRRRLLA